MLKLFNFLLCGFESRSHATLSYLLPLSYIWCPKRWYNLFKTTSSYPCKWSFNIWKFFLGGLPWTRIVLMLVRVVNPIGNVCLVVSVGHLTASRNTYLQPISKCWSLKTFSSSSKAGGSFGWKNWICGHIHPPTFKRSPISHFAPRWLTGI